MGQPEALLQAEIVRRLRSGWPQALVAAIPNGGFPAPARAVARLKWQGLTPGMPDLVLSWPGGGVGWIEVKAARGRLSEAQRRVIGVLRGHGHRVAVIRSLDELAGTVGAWGLGERGGA